MMGIDFMVKLGITWYPWYQIMLLSIAKPVVGYVQAKINVWLIFKVVCYYLPYWNFSTSSSLHVHLNLVRDTGG